MPKTIPQDKRLPPKKGFDIITVYDAKGNQVSQRYSKTQTIRDALRKKITDKPDKNATGTGGRKRESKVMEAVDEAVKGAS